MAIWTILLKDISLEMRTRETLATMVVFTTGVILLFSFAFNAAPATFGEFAPGLMWMTYFFSASLGLLRLFGREKEMDAFSLLLSSPVERGAIYLGKLLAFVIFLLVVQAISLPLFGIFLSMPLLRSPEQLILIVMVTDVAIAALGSLISGMSLRSPMGEVLLPLLLFPLLTPILIAATRATTLVLEQRPFQDWDLWFMLLLTFAGVFTIVGYLIFDYISEQ